MAVKTLSYLDISEKLRRQVATQETTRLKSSLSNPALTPEQNQQIRDRIAHLNRWAAGKLGSS